MSRNTARRTRQYSIQSGISELSNLTENSSVGVIIDYDDGALITAPDNEQTRVKKNPEDCNSEYPALIESNRCDDISITPTDELNSNFRPFGDALYEPVCVQGNYTNGRQRTLSVPAQDDGNIVPQLHHSSTVPQIDHNNQQSRLYIPLLQNGGPAYHPTHHRDCQCQGVTKSYNRLKNLFVALCVFNIVVLLLCVTVIPVVLVTKLTGTGGLGDPPVTPTPDPVPHIHLCMDCHQLQLKTTFSGVAMETLKDGQDPTQCCLQSASQVLDLVEEEVRQVNERSSNRIKKELDERLQLIGTNRSSNLYNKPLLYAKGEGAKKMPNNGFSLQWQSLVVQGNVQLSDDGMAIKVLETGTYFVFNRVHVSHSKSPGDRDSDSETFSFSHGLLRVDANDEMYPLDEISQNCHVMSGAEHSSVLHTVVELRFEDKLYVHMPTVLNLVKGGPNSPVLGLFMIS